MPFTNSIHNEELLTPSAEFIEAKSLISAGRGWKKWPKLISKSAYERVCTDARNCLETIGVREKAIGHFLHETIDHYLEYGTLKPKYMQFMYELGLFVIFKRMIDEAISRRVKAIKAAALRKARKESEKLNSEVANAPEESLKSEKTGTTEHEPETSANTQPTISATSMSESPEALTGCSRDCLPPKAGRFLSRSVMQHFGGNVCYNDVNNFTPE